MSVSTHKISKRILNLSLAVAVSTALLFALLYGDGSSSARAQTADTPTPEATAEPGDGFGDHQLPPIEGKLNPPQYSNIDSNLNHIVQQAQSGQFTAQAAAANAPVHSGASVAVTLYTDEGYTQDVWDWLEESGADPRNIGTDYIEAYIPVSLLPDASQQEGVISIRTIVPPQPVQGAVVSEGVAAHGVPAWHDAGLKGQGVKIGVIDVGFKDFESLMGTELPSTVEARCYTDVGIFTSNLTDCIPTEVPESSKLHGTAVTEAAFDIAPEADYYIANISSLGDLLDTVDWMASEGVDVINMSVGFLFHGPGDGTSPFGFSSLASVDNAVSDGIIWVNAAGNSARANWFGAFTDSNANGAHQFSATGNECNGVIIQLDPFEGFTAQLRWEDSWGGASSDLDLYLVSLSGNTFRLPEDAVGKSEEVQAGEADDIPFERIRIEYGDIPDGRYCLAVNRYAGATPDWVQILVWGAAGPLQYYTPAHSIANPAESENPGLLAVGAAGRNGSVSNPFDTTIIEPFSSRGPTLDDRIKPDIVGADAGQSVTYRSERNPNGYFFGTSQASPHVAGLAALVKQRFPDKSPQQIAQYLKDSTEARDTLPNNTWGYGFAKLPASDATAPEPTPTPEPTVAPQPSPEPTPNPPEVPEEVLTKISALETLVATLQRLISTLESKITTLDSRVAALETNASAPTPIPTATLAPIPTTVPGVPTPIPTPTPPSLFSTATPITVACVTPITGNGVFTASWITTCQSTNRPLDPDKPDDGTYYARYYTFDISTPSLVTITLESSEDTFLYLLNEKGKTGSVTHANDDIEYRVNTNSRIQQQLEAGSYTIEAATYDSGVSGSSFTLTLSGIE